MNYVMVVLKRFDRVVVIYSVRGHSYMKCDKSMAFINQKTTAEILEDWRETIEKPSPFHVVECTTDMFKVWGNALQEKYINNFTSSISSIREIVFNAENTQTIPYRDNCNSAFSSTVIVKK